MKTFSMVLLGISLILVSLPGCGQQQGAGTAAVDSTAVVADTAAAATYPALEPRQRLLVATTTSLYDTGLWAYLEPMFEEQYGVELDILYAGTGKAIEWGTDGDVDVMVVHDRAREEQFIADSLGVSRTPFAYNFFVIVGPAEDPAGISGMAPESAFVAIYENGTVPFISRGDESGTHAKEQRLWAAAGYDYEQVRTAGEWYVEAGQGMGPTLNMANEMRGYTLSDIGTFLAYQGDVDLDILVEQGETMRNVYAVIPVVSAHDPVLAQDMVTFLTSPEIQAVIGDYGVAEYGRQLFTPAAGQDL
jgi:tungstate transport system substrate-binding protein